MPPFVIKFLSEKGLNQGELMVIARCYSGNLPIKGDAELVLDSISKLGNNKGLEEVTKKLRSIL